MFLALLAANAPKMEFTQHLDGPSFPAQAKADNKFSDAKILVLFARQARFTRRLRSDAL